MPQVGVYPSELDHSVFVRHDGSVALTAFWNSLNVIRGISMQATQGGSICVGNSVNWLRIAFVANEIAQILGVSNNLCDLNMKNSTMSDLAGIGVRAVVADVNGKLSAP